jgi:hypothetical protein
MKIPDFSFLKFELENPNQRILKFAELFSVKYIGKEKEKRERERLSYDDGRFALQRKLARAIMAFGVV